MNNFIIYCPHLNRDIRGILARVPDPQIFTGYPTVPGEVGCLKAHKEIVRKAQHNGWPYVFVMEDDCEFTQYFNYNEWLKNVNWASKFRYHALVGGTTRTWSPKVVFPGFIQVKKFCSAHCIVYFACGYEHVLNAEQPLDQSVGESLIKLPFVAIQRPSFSGILQQDVDYRLYYESQERLLGCL